MTKHFCQMLFAIACLCVAGGADAQMQEVEVRNKVNQQAFSALLEKDIEALESVSKELRTTKAKTPSGVWRLSSFYDGVEGATGFAAEKQSGMDINQLLETVDRWQKKYPESPSALVTKGVILQKRAWLIRGHGYAGAVAGESWKPFYDGIAQARAYFESVKVLASADPAWYCQMAHIAKAQHWPRSEFDAFAKEVLARHPDYHQAIFCTAEYLAPRWYFESTQTLEKFADDAVAATQSEVGKMLYARIYWAVSAGSVDTKVFGEKFYVWPKVRAGFDDLVARYPDAWNLNHYAKFSCLVGDGEQFRKLAERIGESPLNYVLSPPFYDRCKRAFEKAEFEPANRAAKVGRQIPGTV